LQGEGGAQVKRQKKRKIWSHYIPIPKACKKDKKKKKAPPGKDGSGGLFVFSIR